MKIVPWRFFLFCSCLALLACGMDPTRLRPDPRVKAQGSFGTNNEWKLRDAVAVRDGDDIILCFARLWFDRERWVLDAELTSEDLGTFLRNEEDYAPAFEVKLDAQGRYLAHRLRYGGYGVKWVSGFDEGEGVVLSIHQQDRIAGTVRLRSASTQAAIEFDLPVLALGPIARPGVPLPADGGEPGRLLLAKSRAIHDGDLDRVLQLMSPRERSSAFGRYDSNLDYNPGDLDMSGSSFFMFKQRLDVPDITRIEGGSMDGDVAWVDFSGGDSILTDEPLTGTAVMIRRRHGWEVGEIITSDVEMPEDEEDWP